MLESLKHCGMGVGIRGGMDWRVSTVIDVMRQELAAPLSVSELARRVNLSPSRLTHLFRTEIGCGPARFLRELRLDRARDLVEQSALSIKEIMATVGFNDPSHFTRDFSARHGASPRRIRARARSPGSVELSLVLTRSSSTIRQQTARTVQRSLACSMHHESPTTSHALGRGTWTPGVSSHDFTVAT
jgi:AraC-like DNA-binding protein